MRVWRADTVGGNPLRHGPAAADARRWSTFGDEPTILAAARTLTSAIRLLEALQAFQGDTRLQVVFTVHETSRFSTGVADLLRALPAAFVEWDDVPDIHYDLVLTASEKVDLSKIDKAPVLVLPHGIGFHKYVPDADSPDNRLSGLVPAELLAGRRVLHLVTHPDQAEQLGAASPATRGNTVLGGDTSYDGLVSSRPLRERYRRALGVEDGQRLVTVTSTWGTQSLIGSWRSLPEQLLAELPADEYRVAAIVHPNAWTRHSEWDLRRRLDRAVKAGDCC